MNLQQAIEKFKSFEECEEYIGASGRKCYRVWGDLSWYFLQCSLLGIRPRWANDLLHTAKGNGFELEYIEGDIILAID